MPGHFTHIYTARRVAEYLSNGKFPDWPVSIGDFSSFTPEQCGQAMTDWEKFTAVGAIGPDLFYFSQDWNNKYLGPISDEAFLILQIYYFYDTNKENDWEGLLTILDGVSSTMAALIRFLIELQKIWDDFVAGWNATIGPIVADIANLADALTGGILSEFKVVLNELQEALKTIGEEELLTFADILGLFNTCVQKGWDIKSFLWSDMSHYRRPSELSRNLIKEAERLKGDTDGECRSQKFLAFALGYITHLGTDTVGHAFVNEQCGGPYRDHPQRHHLIENHIDAWNYEQAGADGKITADPWAADDNYPTLSMSAMWFHIQLWSENPTEDKPPADVPDPFKPKSAGGGGGGVDRPSSLPDDPDARAKALDVDGEMPLWMAESIVRALLATFPDDADHPQILGGKNFQTSIDSGLLTKLIMQVTGHGLDKPFDELLAAIAPQPPADIDVKPGFPLPWQLQTTYKIMYSFYRLQYNGTWELQKPQSPSVIITPPASDVQNLLQAPDFSGADSSNPLVDVCEAILAIFEWIGKEIGAAIQLIEDIVKMILSPFTYGVRVGLYQLAMYVWDIVCKVHDVLAHTGFFIPYSQQTYDRGELRLPNEIDIPLITLGGTVDGAFLAALAAAYDPLGNLDKDINAIGKVHSVTDPNYPYFPVVAYHLNSSGGKISFDAWEFRRPWAYPTVSVDTTDGTHYTEVLNLTETYDPSKTPGAAPNTPTGAYKPLRPGPFPVGTMPDAFFELGAALNSQARTQYEAAQTPYETDQLNEANIAGGEPINPLGNPVQFSAYLIGRLVNETGYTTQFNLDSDRAFAYLTWDWIRQDTAVTAPPLLGVPVAPFTYNPPVVPPPGAADWSVGNAPASLNWDFGVKPLQLKYVDPPVPVVLPTPQIK